MTEWIAIGPHRYCSDGDALLWEPHGLVEKEHAAEIVEVLLAHGRRHEVTYFVVDSTDAQPLPAETRRVYADALRQHRPRIIIISYGAGPLNRITATLALRAGAIIAGIDITTHAVASRKEAQSLLDTERAKRSRKQEAPSLAGGK